MYDWLDGYLYAMPWVEHSCRADWCWGVCHE